MNETSFEGIRSTATSETWYRVASSGSGRKKTCQLREYGTEYDEGSTSTTKKSDATVCDKPVHADQM